jgi:hypothetical protein
MATLRPEYHHKSFDSDVILFLKQQNGDSVRHQKVCIAEPFMTGGAVMIVSISRTDYEQPNKDYLLS